MARLTMAQRKALPKSAFAVPSKAPGPGSFPMNDAAHVVAAKRMARTPSDKAAVAKKAAQKKASAKGSMWSAIANKMLER